MKSEIEDPRRELSGPGIMGPVLLKLQAQAHEFPPPPETFNLVQFLKENHVLQPKFAENLQKWPTLIQTYINKELLDFVRDEKEFKQEDIEVIDRFFETALQETEPCEGDQIPDARWRQAMAALAQELRRYYGLEENDTELPCWRF